MRLAKHLATAGVASRRASEELIRDGRVTVDGEVVTDPATDVTSANAVAVDGRSVQISQTRVVYALNKPPGVVSTASDPQGRPTVVSLVGGELRLFPVGRLDIDTTGLILLTNDGELANLLTHPRFEVEKTYRAVVGGGEVGERALRLLRRGVELQDGRTAPAKVRRVAPAAIEITIHEGRKRQVRRMCEAVGHPVKELTRVRFGPLELGELRLGANRRLGESEVMMLRRAAAGVTRRAAGSSLSAPARPRGA